MENLIEIKKKKEGLASVYIFVQSFLQCCLLQLISVSEHPGSSLYCTGLVFKGVAPEKYAAVNILKY